jgi:hypothetical protein
MTIIFITNISIKTFFAISSNNSVDCDENGKTVAFFFGQFSPSSTFSSSISSTNRSFLSFSSFTSKEESLEQRELILSPLLENILSPQPQKNLPLSNYNS